jgi:hypothetical protein
MRWLTWTVIVVALSVPAVYGDSIFDVRGAGRDVVAVAGVSRAMGGAVAASRDPLDCSVMSPFASALSDGVTMSAGLVHVNTRTDDLGEKKRSISTIFPTIAAIIPFRGISFMTGLYLEKEGRLTISLTDSAYGGQYDFDYRRETSVHTVPFFVSTDIRRRLLVSAGILFSAFDMRETHTTDFVSDERVDAVDASDLSASGRAFAAGFMIDLDRVRLAAMYRSDTDLDGALDRESRYAEVWDSRDISLTTQEAYKVGIRVQPHRFFSAEVDYETSPWCKMKLDGEPIGDSDVYRWSAGMAYRGPIPWNAAKYPLLAGYYRQPLDWESPLTGEIVEEVYSIGTSIPLAKDRAALSLALEFGRREARDRSDLSERFYGLALSVSAIEAWRREVKTSP